MIMIDMLLSNLGKNWVNWGSGLQVEPETWLQLV